MSTRRDRAARAVAAGLWPAIELDDAERVEAYRIADMVLAEVDRIPDVSEVLAYATAEKAPPLPRLGRTTLENTADKQACNECGDEVYHLSTEGWCDGCEADAACPHSESLYGRCVFCGMPWEKQAEQRAARSKHPMTDDGAVRTGEEPTPLATGARSPGPVVTPLARQPRLFELYRHQDVTGLSGTGTVAWGTHWPDGAVALRWTTEHPSTVHWDSLDAVLAVHGHSGATVVRWLDGDQ